MTAALRWKTVALGLAALATAVPGSAGDLIRVDFEGEAPYAETGGIFGEPILFTGLEDPAEDLFDCDGEAFDLIDLEDDGNACLPAPDLEGVSQSDLSGGGRWMLSTVSGESPLPVRTVGIAFLDTDTSTGDADCDGLSAVGLGGELGGATCSCSSPCFVQARMVADRVFKRGAERQAFSISVLKETSPGSGAWPPQLEINYVNPLFICPGADPSLRWLQTEACGGGVSVSEAEVAQILPPSYTDRVPLGRWNLPLKIELRRVPRPGGGDGGGGACNLLPKGAACTSGAECCSGKCSGRSGAAVCR